ncbi:aldose epimerase, partial [Neisseria sp. P0015.S004]
FGRTSDWEIRHQNESDIGLKLIRTEKGYEHVEWLLDYSLPNENEAIAILTVCNYGESPVRTSPGFHPYFTAVGTQFNFHGAPYNAYYISHTEFVSSD